MQMVIPKGSSTGGIASGAGGAITTVAPAPSNYATGVIVLDGIGVGGAIATGTLDLLLTVATAPTAGNFVLIGFGNTLAEAQAQINTATPYGNFVSFAMERASAAETSVYMQASSATVTVPQSLTTPFYAIAETGTPAGELFVGMRG